MDVHIIMMHGVFFMSKKINYLNKIYEKNHETGDYIVEVSLDSYTDIFNEWDHASYKKRDMDPELALFIENCSLEIPFKYGINICFCLPKEVQNTEKEKIIESGFKTYYNFYTDFEMKDLRYSYRKVAGYIITSFLLLSIAYILSGKSHDIFFNTLTQGFTVGGWVFLWEAISFFFFKKSSKVDTIRNYERLANAPIYFRYDSHQN